MKKSLAFGILSASLLFILNVSQTQAVFQKNLYQGLSGDPDVVALQNILKDNGYLDGDATGDFDATTKQAVKDFQTDNGISPTGTVGPKTRAKLFDENTGTTDGSGSGSSSSSSGSGSSSGDKKSSADTGSGGSSGTTGGTGSSGTGSSGTTGSS